MKKYKIQLYILGFIWITSFQNIVAQSNYIFHHLNTNEGLPSTNVKAILRDNYGFLWIGTEGGLNRYDGYGFKVYTTNPGKPNALLSNNIYGLQEDGRGNIWVDLGYTYMVYWRDKDCFISDVKLFLKKLHIQTDQNYKIYVDKKRNLWVLNNKKIFLYNFKKQHISVFNVKDSIKDVSSINITDNGESLYYIQPSGKCWQLNGKSGKLTLIKLPDSINKKTANYPAKIFFDSDNDLWVYGDSDQISYRNKQTQQWKTMVLKSQVTIESNTVTSIVENSPGEVWIGTDHNGLFIYDKTRNLMTNIVYDSWKDNSLSSNNINCLYRDNNETIWIGHSKKGLSFYNESFRNFINFKYPQCSDISAIMEDHRENIWLGTDGKGLFLKEKQSENIVKLPISNTSIMSIIEDRKGRIWIGTFKKGLFCYQKGKMVQYTKENSKLSNNNIWSLMEDRYGNIWIGTLGGKIQLLPAAAANFDFLLSPFKEDVYALDMFYDGGDKIFVGTSYGLSVIDITNNKNVMYYGNKKGNQKFKQLQISSVYKDKHDVIWLAHNNGLDIWDQKEDTIYYFNKSNGLCDNSTKGILEDGRNNIWVTTSNGLSILTVKRNINEKLIITSKNYSIKDGLMDNYFNRHSIIKLRNGDFLLGNIDGYTILNPNKLVEKNRPIAKIVFAGLSVGNQNIEVDSIYNGRKLLEHSTELTSGLTFKHDDKLITLKFTTADLLNADKVKYIYKIEGFDTEWIPIQENKIILSALPPGDYKLLIKASNSDGVWKNNATVLPISVTPPFYLSLWAFCIYGIIGIVILLYLNHKSKVRNLLKIEEHRIKMDREKEWQINEMKLKFFTNISHDLRTPLTLITTPLQVLLSGTMEENMRNKLSIMYKNANQLLSLINSLLDFRKLDVGIDTLNLKSGNFINFIRDIHASFSVYADERNIHLSVSSELENLLMQFDKDKIQKTLTNLLSNAFKYTPDGGNISIHISKEEDDVCVRVSDTGSGINDEDKTHVFERFYQAPQRQGETGSGIGLHIANEYVNLHGGTITIKDNTPKGCIFTFKIPIREIDNAQRPLTTIQSSYDNVENIEKKEIIRSKPILLFVDDNKDFCDFMADNLGDEYSVATAYNGQEAIEQLNKYAVTIIVSDVMMPVMDGIELCKQVKTNIHWSHIPIILLTARTAEEHQIEGLELGADDYITKPFHFNLLRLRIQKFIEWTKKSHRAFSQKIDVNPSEITITSLDEMFIKKAIKIVEDNLGNLQFSVEILGADLGLSRGHLYKKLIIITGKGPAEFIRTIRLKRGRQLLEKSQLQISQIAHQVGFNSPKIFSKYFREEFGLSPSEYLKAYKKL
ncbi:MULTISPECIES: hybrid sensor histidine kinase/response regulator transcription factor [Flavobacterium]|uniref:hybrid sensor histidine kinase/response regulator transcription factor n=1 Tax=Flavobacterium TaxID=237 RepID=UPI002113FEBC|nr:MULTISPECIES: hybrid sensor histidine kinase/response regulator transcription factor [Flavobacterium]UUF12483.1 ATP-binding protein [Flavobacterium panici]